MEATDYVGTIGRVQFLPEGDPHVHGLRTGAGFITGLFLQWQNGEQVNLWPADLAKGKLMFPALRQGRESKDVPPRYPMRGTPGVLERSDSP